MGNLLNWSFVNQRITSQWETWVISVQEEFVRRCSFVALIQFRCKINCLAGNLWKVEYAQTQTHKLSLAQSHTHTVTVWLNKTSGDQKFNVAPTTTAVRKKNLQQKVTRSPSPGSLLLSFSHITPSPSTYEADVQSEATADSPLLCYAKELQP